MEMKKCCQACQIFWRRRKGEEGYVHCTQGFLSHIIDRSVPQKCIPAFEHNHYTP